MKGQSKYPQEVINAIAQDISTGMVCFLNTDTMELESVIDQSNDLYCTEDEDELYREVYDKVNRWKHSVRIEPPESRQSFKIMEDFIENSIPDNDPLKSRLRDAISGSKPFQHFKSIIDNSQYRRHWFAFKQSQLEQFVLEHLI